MSELTPAEKYEAYIAYCKEKGYPDFAGRRCYDCGKDIWDGDRAVWEAYPTGCPYCYRSYCD